MAATIIRSEFLLTRQQLYGAASRPARTRRVGRAIDVRARVVTNTHFHTSRKLAKRGDTLRAAAWPMDWLKEQGAGGD
eukprot:9494625-Pyramimonas_sp.AAC.2